MKKENIEYTKIESLLAEANTLIQSTLNKGLEWSKTKAKELALINRPLDEDIAIYTHPLKAMYKELKFKLTTLLNVEVLKAKAFSVRQRFLDELQLLNNSAVLLSNEQRLIEYEISNLNADHLFQVAKKWKNTHLIILLLLFGETIINYRIFGVINSGIIWLNFVTAISISGAIYYIVKAQFLLYHHLSSKRHRILMLLVANLIVIGGFIALAYLRQEYLALMDQAFDLPYSGLIFVGLNFLLYIGVVSATFANAIAPNEQKKISKLEALQKKLVIKSKCLKQCNERRLEIPVERDELLGAYLTTIEAYPDIMERVKQGYQHCLYSFVQTNTFYRTDGHAISGKMIGNTSNLDGYTINNTAL